ncbi:MAG: LVIVD repeat-containing protein [Candidatus Thorarchaeota archaeon]
MKTHYILACLVFFVLVSSSGFGVDGNQIAQSNGPGYEITINETHAFVSNNYGVAVYDIQDPAAPARLAQISLGGEAEDVIVLGDILYIGALSRGLVIANISEDPTSPTILTEYTLSDYVTRLCIQGNYAFISSGYGEIQIIDISNPSDLGTLGHLTINELTLDIAVHDDTVYLAQPFSGLKVINVSDLNSPQLLSLVSGTSGARDLHVQGDLLYVARGSSGVGIFDISDSTNPTVLGQFSDVGEAFGLHGDDQYLCIADLEDGVELIDISDSESPVEVAHYDDAAPHDVIYREGYAYLADQDEEFLLIDIELSNTGTTTGESTNPFQFITTILVVTGVCAIVIIILIVLKKR